MTLRQPQPAVDSVAAAAASIKHTVWASLVAEFAVSSGQLVSVVPGLARRRFVY